ncbi:MAG: outer membrane beta-barrel protein [Bacteroidetes bacterium]|nr:outer membrane beta-barrel protein [Bacteroidota bacterium]
MRSSFLPTLCYGLILGTVTLFLPPAGTAHGWEHSQASWLSHSGGDVLRPGKTGTSRYQWHLGIDAGLTNAMFFDGPLAYYVENPHNPRYVLPGHVDKGSGLGFYFGVTADFPVTNWVGIMLKGHYHTRVGVFDETIDLGEIHPATETMQTTLLRNQSEWSFNYFGLDILLRVDLGNTGGYVMFGPALASLSGNDVSLTQDIIRPDDIFYTEDVSGEDMVINEFRSASTNGEVAGFADTRVDLKAGLGWRFDLNSNLMLVPEIAIAIPFTSHVENVEVIPQSDAAIFDWYSDETMTPFVSTDDRFNMTTVFFTVGLRWRIGS